MDGLGELLGFIFAARCLNDSGLKYSGLKYSGLRRGGQGRGA
jgi:hypothetical protein